MEAVRGVCWRSVTRCNINRPLLSHPHPGFFATISVIIALCELHSMKFFFLVRSTIDVNCLVQRRPLRLCCRRHPEAQMTTLKVLPTDFQMSLCHFILRPAVLPKVTGSEKHWRFRWAMSNEQEPWCILNDSTFFLIITLALSFPVPWHVRLSCENVQSSDFFENFDLIIIRLC